MIRSFSIALAVAALAFATDAAFAGGGSNQTVRIKNIGSASTLVNAKTGSATGSAGAKTVNQNGVAQFTTKKVASQAWAKGTGNNVPKTLNYSFPRSQLVYLQAAADGSTTTLTCAPPGVRF